MPPTSRRARPVGWDALAQASAAAAGVALVASAIAGAALLVVRPAALPADAAGGLGAVALAAGVVVAALAGTMLLRHASARPRRAHVPGRG